MVNLRSFEVPTVMKHAPGAVECLADEVRSWASKRPMLVTDGGLVKAGIAERVTDVLKAGSVDYFLFDGVIANPQIRLVNEAGMRYLGKSCDGLIGLGSGSPMDTAKAIGVVVTNGGSILEYEWADPQPIRKRIPPLITVPTTAGTGSEVTLWSVITDPARHIKYNVGGTGLIRLGRADRPAADAGHARAHHGQHRAGCADARHRVLHLRLCPALARRSRPVGDGDAGAVAAHRVRPGAQPEGALQGGDGGQLAGMSYGTESTGAVHAMSQTAGGSTTCRTAC